MTEQELIKAIGNGTETEISALVLKLEQAGTLAALCAQFDFKAGRSRNYRKAAMTGLRKIAAMFAMMQ